MKNFTRLSLFTFCAFSALTIGASNLPVDGKIDLFAHRYRNHCAEAFNTKRDARIDRLTDKMYGYKIIQKAPASEYQPDFTLGPSNMTGDIDAPGGKRWYYTASYEYDMIPADHDAGIWFDNYILRHYRFDIYDEKCNYLGTIDSPMNYEDDEEKIANIEIAPVASRHFFNTDDKIEIIVGMSINTNRPGLNHYRSVVYSLEGKDKSVDTPVAVIYSLLSDVVEGPFTPDGKDNFYMVFARDVMPEDVIDDDEEASYWDYVTAARIDMDIMGPAKDASGPAKITTKQLPILQWPGDQESTPYLLSYVHDGKVNYLFSYLEEPIWDEYDDPLYGELRQRDNNKLNLEFYQVIDGKLDMVHKTSIDVVRDPEDYTAIASFFGVGDMNYTGDLLYEAPGASDVKPWLVVTRSNYNPSSDKSSQSYFLYDGDGKFQRELALYCESTLGLADIPGEEPQQLFITREGGQYLFRFVDIYSAKERFTMTNYFLTPEGYTEALLANIDRTPIGEGYRYAIELSQPVIDVDNNTLVRVLWLDEKGKYVRIDNVNAGQDVMYAKMYIEGAALQPDAFCADNAHEYLYLVKRGIPGSPLSEELFLSQPVTEENPEGKHLLNLTADNRGALSGIIPLLGGENPSLTVYYYNEGSTAETTFAQDVYLLPLGGASGVNSIDGEMPGIKVEDSLLQVTDYMTIYSLTGAKVGEAKGTFDLSYLPEGIYIVVTEGRSYKIYVK